MPWPLDIAGDLPAPRDDEPSSLRQDIADELVDHLKSSFTRELHITSEESSAKQNVLDRFGDPRRVARQLWYDSMKEKLMSQRLLTVTLLATWIACAGSVGLTWLLINESRQANQLLFEQNQAANAALFEKLALLAVPAPAPVAESEKTLEWTAVRVRLVLDKPGSPPAVGYEAQLGGKLHDAAAFKYMTRKTEGDGIADFGFVRAGAHSLEVQAPWMDYYHIDEFVVVPGRERTVDLVCPAEPREEGSVTFAVDWPAGIADRNLWLLCEATQGKRQVQEKTWNNKPAKARQYFILTAANDVIPLPEVLAVQAFSHMAGGYWAHDLFFSLMNRSGAAEELGKRQDKPGFFFRSPWPQVSLAALAAPVSSAPGKTENTAVDVASLQPFRPYYLRFADSVSKRELKWPAAPYTLENIVVCEAASATDATGSRTMNVLAGLIAGSGRALSYEKFPDPFRHWTDVSQANAEARPGADQTQSGAEEKPVFEVQAARSNHWKIVPPSALLDLMNTYVKECEGMKEELKNASSKVAIPY